jgi:hypothetical protein
VQDVYRIGQRARTQTTLVTLGQLHHKTLLISDIREAKDPLHLSTGFQSKRFYVLQRLEGSNELVGARPST